MAGRSWLGWGALAAVLAVYAGSQNPQVGPHIQAAKAKVLAVMPAIVAARFAPAAVAATDSKGEASAGVKSDPAANSDPAAMHKPAASAAPSGGPSGKRVAPPAPVVTAKVSTGTLPLRLEGVGNVQARTTVSIKARVDGQLMEAAIKEGQVVKKGDLLFRLDPRPFEAVLRQTEAALARDKANLEKARSDYARTSDLVTKGYSPKAKFDETKAAMMSLEATVKATETTIDVAKLNVEYTVIRSPITGRAGNLLVHPGNMVKANDTQALVVVTEMAPVYVAFAVPERYLGDMQKLMAGAKVAVEAWTPENKADKVRGELFFMNNVVDAATGTITLMASFDNTDKRLVPGQFVQASAVLGTLTDVVIAPSRAVQVGQKGTYIYVVKDDLTVEFRPVTTGPSVDDTTVITKGLAAGETVVTEGQLRLTPGAKVMPKAAGGGKPKEQS